MLGGRLGFVPDGGDQSITQIEWNTANAGAKATVAVLLGEQLAPREIESKGVSGRLQAWKRALRKDRTLIIADDPKHPWAHDVIASLQEQLGMLSR